MNQKRTEVPLHSTDNDAETSADGSPQSACLGSRCSEDLHLAGRLIEGDRTAWDEFIRDAQQLLHARVVDVATIFGRGRDEDLIDDAVAEVFAALLVNQCAALRAFAGRSTLRTYVAIIATRSAMRTFSRSVKVAGSDGVRVDQRENMDTTESWSSESPFIDLVKSENRQRLHQLVERLPDKQRRLIQGYYFAHRSYNELSDEMRIPIGSIGVMLRRAEAKLRNWLEERHL